MIRVAAFIAALAAAALTVWLIGNHVFVDTKVAPPPKVDVPRSFPTHDENETASRFLATVTRFNEAQLENNRYPEIEYIRREVLSPDAESALPPNDLAKFLASSKPAIQAMRAQLASDPPPIWKQQPDDLVDTPQPDIVLLTRIVMTLSADALAEHSAHSDAAAWSDLGAVWVLTRSLWLRPEISSVLMALTGSRLIAAVATKLPPPAPPWWSEFTSYDIRTPLRRSMEYEAWAIRTRADNFPAGEPDDDGNPLHETVRRAVEPFARPIKILEADARVRDLRELIQRLATIDPCGSLPEAARARWTGTLVRFNHFLVEREGVAKLVAAEEIHAKSGTWPATIDDHSLCAGRRWVYTPTPAGMQLTFHGHIAAPQTRIVTPLEYKR